MSLEDKECRLQWEDYMECKTMVKEVSPSGLVLVSGHIYHDRASAL